MDCQHEGKIESIAPVRNCFVDQLLEESNREEELMAQALRRLQKQKLQRDDSSNKSQKTTNEPKFVSKHRRIIRESYHQPRQRRIPRPVVISQSLPTPKVPIRILHQPIILSPPPPADQFQNSLTEVRQKIRRKLLRFKACDFGASERRQQANRPSRKRTYSDQPLQGRYDQKQEIDIVKQNIMRSRMLTCPDIYPQQQSLNEHKKEALMQLQSSLKRYHLTLQTMKEQEQDDDEHLETIQHLQQLQSQRQRPNNKRLSFKQELPTSALKNSKPFNIIKGSLYSKLLKKSTAEDRKKKGFTYKMISRKALIKGTQISLLRSSSEQEQHQEREDIVNMFRTKREAGLTLRSWKRRGQDIVASFRSQERQNL